MAEGTKIPQGDAKIAATPKVVAPMVINSIGEGIRKSAGKISNRRRKKILKNSLADQSISKSHSLSLDEGITLTLKLIELFNKHKIGRTLRKRKDEPQEPIKRSMSLIVVGINSVTRCLEKNEASLVLVDSLTEPPIITSHLYRQAETYDIPIISVNINDIKACLNVQSLTTIAFKTLKSYDERFREDLLEISKHIPNTFQSTTLNNDHGEPTSEIKTEPVLREHTSVKSEPMINPLHSLPPREELEIKLKLPDDNIDFTTLYKYRSRKRSSVFTADFLGFSEDITTNTNTTRHLTNRSKIRYHDTQLAFYKHNPNRDIKRKS